MTERPQADPRQTATATPDQRRAWVTPSYVQVRAGDAELGPNPGTTDNFFTKS